MATTATDLPRKHKLSATDYHRLAEAGSLRADDRVELIDGDIIDVAPVGTRHAGIVDQLGWLLQRAIGDAALIRAQGPVHLGEHSEPEPDIALLKSRHDFYKPGHPRPADILLIIEVADTSLGYDRDVKIPLYARHGILEVWLIDIESQQLTIYRQPDGDSFQDVIDPVQLTETTLSALPGISVDLTALF